MIDIKKKISEGNSIKKHVNDASAEQERQEDIKKQIKAWKTTNEFERLSTNARKLVENFMLFKQKRHSDIYIWLNKLAERAETYYPTGGPIPIYEKHFLERKFK